jgi:hypothetical protein
VAHRRFGAYNLDEEDHHMPRPSDVELHEAERELERCSEEVARRRSDLAAAEARRTEARQRVEELRKAQALAADEELRAAVSRAPKTDRVVN